MSLRVTLNKNLKKLEKPYEPYNEITLSRSALLNNYEQLSLLIPSRNVFPVLKSNAYGHGILEVATILKEIETPYIAVDGFYESLPIHSISQQPVLVMGAIKPENYQRMNFKRTAFVVHDTASIRAIGVTNRRAIVHIEIDTGMTRHGVAPNELPQLLAELKKHRRIVVEGVMTHLADADNPESDAFNNLQTKLFDDSIDTIIHAGFTPKYFHIAQSAGSAKIKSRYANALRTGLALYGINPLERSDKAYNTFQNLQPVLSLHSAVTKVTSVTAGTTVSYGRTFKANTDTFIGVLPLGYYEGVKRALNNVGFVAYKDSYLKITGKVCMNHTMIDLGTSGASVGEKVTLISADPASRVSLSSICQQYNLFSYEVLVGLSQNIRRQIVE
jgi:alanine racemase